jgi:hypothetical protein
MSLALPKSWRRRASSTADIGRLARCWNPPGTPRSGALFDRPRFGLASSRPEALQRHHVGS